MCGLPCYLLTLSLSCMLILRTEGLRPPVPSSGALASKYQQILETCVNCIETSNDKFTSGGSKSSNAKPQMGKWLEPDLLDSLVEELEDTYLDESSNFGGLVTAANLPVVASLTKSNEANDIDFDVNILRIPPGGILSSRVHAAGTVLLYRILEGEGNVVSIVGDRIISSNFLSLTNSSLEFSKVIRRIGGPARIISATSNETGFTLLEMALHPPAYSDSSYEGGGIGVKLDVDEAMDKTRTALFPIPTGYLDSLFISGEQYKEQEAERAAARRQQQSQQEYLLQHSPPPLQQQQQQQQQGNGGYIDGQNTRSIRDSLGFNIGGLDKQLDGIVRRILLSRRISPQRMQSLGIAHVKGLLLHGPPGTGKTLIAREIARALNAREPKIINGPEIMDKFVGEAERNIRALFADAEAEWALLGPASPLHVIIFDELDSIAKPRGSLEGDGSGVRDSCVNQLLSQIDGVAEMNNVLVVGLTNRKDLIDPALLRSGRLEVHLRVNPPDEQGRAEILAIAMRSMVAANVISLERATEWCMLFASAEYTEGWTGADLIGMLRSAVSFALDRYFLRMEEEEEEGIEEISPAAATASTTTAGRNNSNSIPISENDLWAAWREVGPTSSFFSSNGRSSGDGDHDDGSSGAGAGNREFEAAYSFFDADIPPATPGTPAIEDFRRPVKRSAMQRLLKKVGNRWRKLNQLTRRRGRLRTREKREATGGFNKLTGLHAGGITTAAVEHRQNIIRILSTIPPAAVPVGDTAASAGALGYVPTDTDGSTGSSNDMSRSSSSNSKSSYAKTDHSCTRKEGADFQQQQQQQTTATPEIVLYEDPWDTANAI